MRSAASIRTDLAVEACKSGLSDDVKRKISQKSEVLMGFETTELIIDYDAAASLGKPAGRYISADFGRLWTAADSDCERAAKLITHLIHRLAPPGDGCVLVAGLGNDRVTPDSVGVKAARHVAATRHIKAQNPSLYSSLSFGECAVLVPGVLGDTGIESADILRGAADVVRPRLIIAVDALSARSMDRMATTVQLSDAGIAPGSGVNNRRTEISQKTMGCPVVSVGFPTVVDAATLTLDMLEDAGASDDVLAAAEEALCGTERPSLFVSPKDCDVITDCLGTIAATAINSFIHG